MVGRQTRDEGADGSLGAFYNASYPRVVAVLTALAGSRGEAEDAVQEAFTRLVPRWEQVAAYDDPDAWVRQVATRILTSRWRRARTAAAGLLRLGAPPTVPEPSPDAVAVQQLLAGLSLAHRQVLLLHHVLGLPLQDVARELQLPVGTVKSRLSRARAAALAVTTEEDLHA